MDPFEEKTDDEVRRCLANAKLSAQKLSDAVETGGRNFSAGERQLLALARTLLHRRKIVVLDEPTANVDTETDNAVQEMLRKEFADSTLLCIAHRLNTVIDFDRILVMADGKVAEYGPAKELLQREGSVLRAMVSGMGELAAAQLTAKANTVKN